MKKSLWIVLAALSVASLFFVYKYFEKVVPFVHLKITMDSAEAREASRELAKKYDWKVAGFDQAVSFNSDGKLQAFIELEGGGKSAFTEMIENGHHQPYGWVVRFYKPQTIPEYLVSFTPEGVPYEFCLKMSEMEQGQEINRSKAESIAREGAAEWGVDLSVYDFVEYNGITQLGGRVDHSFVYERSDVTLQKGLYRLMLQVNGDVFAGLDRSVKIPDEFNRRYAQMFADNQLLASMARNIAIFIYLFIIALFAAVFFYKNFSYLFLKQHAYLMTFFAALFFISSLNQWPLIWNKYPTHMAPWFFGLNAALMIAAGCILFSIFVGLICVVTDAADRFMFGRHIQFLKTWTKGVAGSTQVLQMTLLGYVFAILALGYETGYGLWTQYMGWWAPLSTLVDPNILSSYLPFLSPVAQAFQAGFWEEFATRGLPIAGVLFLTRNSRHKAWWLGAVMVGQAIIFGALHANYPQMPAYYRLVELFLPSLGWGSLYYFFGLFPGIVAHFVYDAVLMCIPIWVSDLMVQKILCVICISIPLIVVFVHFLLQKGKLLEVAKSAYNHTVAYTDPLSDQALFHRSVGKPSSLWLSIGLICFAALSLGSLYFANQRSFAVQKMSITRSGALSLATSFVKETIGDLGDAWTITVEAVSPINESGNKFIWQMYGQEIYEELQSSFVVPIYYLVSWKKFTGPVEDRAEEINVMVGAENLIIGMRHTFPEGQEGEDITDGKAEKIALEAIESMYRVESSGLELVSTESKKHASRRDFKIIFKDTQSYTLDRGQGQITVKIAGDQLAEINRKVHAPEDWVREDQSRETKERLFKTILWLIILAWYFIAVVLGLKKYGLSEKWLIPVGFLTIAFALIRGLQFANSWTQVVNHLSTSEPWMHQMISMISSCAIGYLGLGFAFSTLMTLFILQGARSKNKKSVFEIFALVLAGGGIACFEMFAKSFKVLFVASEPQYEFVNYTYPAMGMLIVYFFGQILPISAMIMALCVVAKHFEKTCNENWIVLLFVFAGIAMSDLASLANIEVWIGSGMLLGIIWYFLYRSVISQNMEAVFLIVLGMLACKMIPSAWYGAYPGMHTDFIICFSLFSFLVAWLYRKI